MTSKELREKFLDFFEKKGHQIVPSSSLVPKDPSVLFTTAGMQQFKDYFLGQPSPFGTNVASCQKCFRTSDIDEVGDATHLTFLEMLGNFSFGGYFKEEAIRLAYEFLFEEFKIPKEEATFTVFEGDKNVPPDEESIRIWQSLGIPENKIKKCGKSDNFWGPTGLEGPCGPTTEIHIKGVEVWNLVFNEYYQNQEGKLTPLKQKGVDTGMGLERLVMIVQEKDLIFETDLFKPLIEALPNGITDHVKRIVADHVRGVSFIISDGVRPSNKGAEYILRRLIRRVLNFDYVNQLTNPEVTGKLGIVPIGWSKLFMTVIQIYGKYYPELNLDMVEEVFKGEQEEFNRVVLRGVRKIYELEKIDSLKGFDLYQTFGITFEMIKDIGGERARDLTREDFDKELEKHREVSRAGAESKFGGHGLGEGSTGVAVRLHTATHLLHAALRQILGNHVQQMGSDITSERTRFDFSHPQKMTKEEIKKVEDLVNQKIKEDLEIKKEEMSYGEAIRSGATAFFKEKYPEKVIVYSIGNFSKEICGGPHVQRTSELGHFQITKEESSGAGVRRIRATLNFRAAP